LIQSKAASVSAFPLFAIRLNPLHFIDIFKLFMHVTESFKNNGVKMRGHGPPISFQDYFNGFLVSKRRFIGSSAPQRIILVGNIHNQSFNRDLIFFDALWITGSILSFVM
jgi:hypothetical protein